MINNNFTDAAWWHNRSYPGWDKAVHFTVEAHLLDNRRLVDFQRAAVVIDTHAGDLADQAICNARWNLTQEQVVLTVFTPASKQIEVALNQVVDHAWNIIRVILQVTVQGSDQVAAGFIDARLHGCGLAEVTAQFDHTDMAAVVVGFSLQGLRRAVSRAVVDDQ